MIDGLRAVQSVVLLASLPLLVVGVLAVASLLRSLRDDGEGNESGDGRRPPASAGGPAGGHA